MEVHQLGFFIKLIICVMIVALFAGMTVCLFFPEILPESLAGSIAEKMAPPEEYTGFRAEDFFDMLSDKNAELNPAGGPNGAPMPENEAFSLTPAAEDNDYSLSPTQDKTER